jgi:hypothetical protein
MQTDERRFGRGERRGRLGLIIAVSLLCVTVLCFLPPIPLGPRYHDFTDKRILLRIPNFLDVLSNVPFMVVGLWGLLWLLRRSSKPSFVMQQERIPYFVFFAGVALTGVGSFWYHMAPDNSRLPWDLIPMTCSFMSILASIIMERIGVKAGLRLLLPLLVLGIASVAYWYLTERQDHGDYRFYLFVQFFPPLLIALIIALFPPRYTGTHYLAVAFIFFVLAKLFELFDKQIYLFTHMISGHSLKHITAGAACYWILRMLQKRRALPGLGEDGTNQSLLDYRRQTV